ncbi:hypothetical protein B0H14DRAFT_2672281 [Mycena olivaceomarginata]|nr:hypothetical protein B0H14DRAFT_2672281 [Mycena olivaceomarginata]
MLASTSLVFASLIALANAHFQLQFPAARGAFSEDKEPTFCDGFDNPASNRTAFPITGGFFKLNSEHASWTATQTPTKFADFATTLFPFTKESGEGVSCFPLDLSSAGLSDGQNVTIEVISFQSPVLAAATDSYPRSCSMVRTAHCTSAPT